MYDYAREIHEDRDRAEQDYRNERIDLLDKSGTEDVMEEKDSVTPTPVKRKRKRIPIKR